MILHMTFPACSSPKYPPSWIFVVFWSITAYALETSVLQSICDWRGEIEPTLRKNPVLCLKYLNKGQSYSFSLLFERWSHNWPLLVHELIPDTASLVLISPLEPTSPSYLNSYKCGCTSKSLWTMGVDIWKHLPLDFYTRFFWTCCYYVPHLYHICLQTPRGEGPPDPCSTLANGAYTRSKVQSLGGSRRSVYRTSSTKCLCRRIIQITFFMACGLSPLISHLLDLPQTELGSWHIFDVVRRPTKALFVEIWVHTCQALKTTLSKPKQPQNLNTINLACVSNSDYASISRFTSKNIQNTSSTLNWCRRADSTIWTSGPLIYQWEFPEPLTLPIGIRKVCPNMTRSKAGAVRLSCTHAKSHRHFSTSTPVVIFHLDVRFTGG